MSQPAAMPALLSLSPGFPGRGGFAAARGSAGILLLSLFAVCSSSDPLPPSAAVFQINVGGESFRLRLDDPQAIAHAEKLMAARRIGVIMGELAAGDGGFNGPYSWHLIPASFQTPDVAIEVCDGVPSYVEEHLQEWLEKIGTYCPWSARISARLR